MRMWRKRLFRIMIVTGVCLLLFFLLRAGDEQKESGVMTEEGKRPVRIGFSEIDSSNPWRVAQQISLINAAADRGFEFLFEEPRERSVQWQLKNIREMLDEGIDYLIVIPASETALGEIIEMLKETDTKLILMECSTWEVNPDDYLFMICTDYYKEGQICAQILHSCYHEGFVSILEVIGEEDSSVAKQRSEGFRDEIRKYPHMKISGQIVGNFDRVTAQKSMEEVLAEEKYYYNAIVAYSDEDGLGVLQALKVAGKTEVSVPIISINGVQDALKAIIAGEYYATVESNPEVGPLVMQLIGSNEQGYAPAKRVFIPYNIFDRENVLEQYKNAYYERSMSLYLHRLNFRTKLIMIFGLVCIIPLIAEMILSYRLSVDNTFEIMEEYTVTNMNVVCEEIDAMFKRALSVCEELENSVNIQEYLRKDFADTPERYSYDLKVSMEMLNQYSSNQDIFGIYVLGENGAQYKSNYNSFRIVNFAEQDWYKELGRTEKSVWFLPHQGSYVVKSEKKNFVSLGKALTDKASGKMNGVAIVEIDEGMIISLLDKYEGSRNGFFVVDEAGNVILKSTFYNDSIQEAFQSIVKIGTGNVENQYYRLCGEQYLISCRKLGNGHWSIYSLVSVEQINATASGTLLLNCIILLVSAIVMLFLIFWASVAVTGPIARLSAGMQEIRNGNLNVSVEPEETKDEIGQLIDNFNLMTATMHQMNEKIYEKQHNLQKAEMKALQAQINPHFLYNSLDSVVWLLRLNRQQEAITMLGAMTKLFKVVLSKGKEYIPVADEISHVENYLLIQKVRYRNKFQYELHIEESVKQYRTIKLLLQPLVENSIYHGISGEVESEKITVSACEKEDNIIFQVADTGKGMTEEELEALRDNIKMLRETTESYGLKNIYERLQIYYMGRAEMIIDSQSDEGTVISISIPKENVGI